MQLISEKIVSFLKNVEGTKTFNSTNTNLCVNNTDHCATVKLTKSPEDEITAWKKRQKSN